MGSHCGGRVKRRKGDSAPVSQGETPRAMRFPDLYPYSSASYARSSPLLAKGEDRAGLPLCIYAFGSLGVRSHFLKKGDRFLFQLALRSLRT
ncbi:MAG: hypothetical protein V7K35_24990 [Nostoc sp.]|uniref:hypothetical protein n=1 Tax=Nostoc sp. TaxID=1180 RepID=UPI002FFAF15D